MHYWTKEEEDYLREYYSTHSREETTKALNEKFNLNLSKTTVISRIKKLKLTTVNDGRFPKGHVPWQLGKPLSEKQRKAMEATMFKKGQIPPNHLPIGSITKPGGDYWKMKIAEPNKWVFLHKYIYEKVYGPIPKDSVVGFVDGNENNLLPENLICMSKGANGYINRHIGRGKTRESCEIDIAIAELVLQIGKQERKE